MAESTDLSPWGEERRTLSPWPSEMAENREKARQCCDVRWVGILVSMHLLDPAPKIKSTLSLLICQTWRMDGRDPKCNIRLHPDFDPHPLGSNTRGHQSLAVTCQRRAPVGSTKAQAFQRNKKPTHPRGAYLVRKWRLGKGWDGKWQPRIWRWHGGDETNAFFCQITWEFYTTSCKQWCYLASIVTS